MKVILLDDESLALDYLEKLLKSIEGVEVIGKYFDVHEGMKAVIREQPNLVFLDIEMPEINGINLAELIHSRLPEVKIAFVTAYDEYAVKAFEINAVDYVLKPLRKERLVETIQRLSIIHDLKVVSSCYPMVCCFQTLHFAWEGNESQVIDVRWRTTKARELFSYLLHHRKQFVRKDVILELLWPNSDFKNGFAQLYSTVYQIRKTLESINFNIEIISSEIGYKIELNDVKLDMDEWEKGLEKLSFITRDTLPKYRKLLQLYQGDYFAEDDYLWAGNEQKRLKVLWHSYIKKLTDYLISIEDYVECILLYLQLQALDPYFEDSYFMLMRLYDAIADRYSVKKQYEALKEMLHAEYDAVPSESIQNWYQNWEEKQMVK